METSGGASVPEGPALDVALSVRSHAAARAEEGPAAAWTQVLLSLTRKAECQGISVTVTCLRAATWGHSRRSPRGPPREKNHTSPGPRATKWDCIFKMCHLSCSSGSPQHRLRVGLAIPAPGGALTSTDTLATFTFS